MLAQCLLRFSQIGRSYKLARKGIGVEHRRIYSESSHVSIRILRPFGVTAGVVLDIHGGGWIVGNTLMNDALNSAMISACSIAVVSVEYRLAVQIPLEELINDCLAAARWLLSDGLPEYRDLPIFIIGESAGAHLAAATLLQLKRWPTLLRRVQGVVLYYGVYDLAGTTSVRQADSDTLILDGPGIVEAFHKLTPGLNDAERKEPPLSPLYGDFHDFPPALMFVGKLDPLQDDTIQMAERWQMASDVEAYLVPEAPHGFIHFPTRMASQVLEHSYKWIRKRIERPNIY
jgi:acetyl esterase/lipase